MKATTITPLILAIIAVSTHGKEVEIRLNRPEQAGQVSGIATHLTQTITRTANRAGWPGETQSESNDTRFRAHREVLAVDGSGQPTRINYRVNEFTCSTQNGQPQELLGPGQVLSAELTGNATRFTRDGIQVVDGEMNNRLSFLNLSGGAGVSLDAIFQTDVPRAVGTPWKIDLNPETGNRLGVPLNGLGARATCVIDRLEKINGIDCAVFTTTIDLPMDHQHLKKFNPANFNLPPPTTFASGALKMNCTVLLPMAPSMPPVSTHLKTCLALKMEIPQPDNRPIHLDVAIEVARVDALTFEPAADSLRHGGSPVEEGWHPTELSNGLPSEPERQNAPARSFNAWRPSPPPVIQTPEYRPAPRPVRMPDMDHVSGYLGSLGIDE